MAASAEIDLGDVERPPDPGRHPELGVDWSTVLLPALLTVVVAGSVLAIGSVHVVTVAVISVPAIVGGVVAIRRGVARSVVLPPPAAITLFLAAFTLVQAIPVSIALLAKFAPNNADVWESAARVLSPARIPSASIALDRGASLVEALKWTLYACVFVMAARVARRRGAIWPAALVFLSALLVAIITLSHGLADMHRVYGFYVPHFAPRRWSIGPLLNPNNLAGYLNLGIFTGLGLLAETASNKWRIPILFGVAVLIGVSVVCASRAGLLALILGAGLLFAILRQTEGRRSRRRRRGQSPSVFIAAAAAFGLVLAALGTSADSWKELLDDRLHKLEVLTWLRPMIAAHPWLGIGRGAFQTVFPAYDAEPRSLVYQYAENFVAQWVCEWGIPVSLFALIAFSWTLGPRALGVTENRVRAGAWVAVVVLLAQNLFDLALEVPSVVIAAAALLGGMWGERQRAFPTDGGASNSRRFRRNSVAWLLGAVGAALVAAVLRWGMPNASSDRWELGRRVKEFEATASEQPNDVLLAVEDAMERHPADPFFPRLAAVLVWRYQHKNPMPWIQLALERELRSGGAHLLLAELLHAHGATNQALMELSLAASFETSAKRPVAMLAVRWSPTDEAGLLRAAPAGADGTPVLRMMAGGVADPDLRDRLLDEAIRRSPTDSASLEQRALIAITALAKTCPTDALAQCERKAERDVEALEHAAPESEAAIVARARLLMAKGDPAAAQTLLGEQCASFPSPASCLKWRVLAALSEIPAVHADAATKAFLAVACAGSVQCAAATSWLGDEFARKRLWANAVTQYERSIAARPNAAVYNKLAGAARQSGQHALEMESLEAAARMRGKHGRDPELEKAERHALEELVNK